MMREMRSNSKWFKYLNDPEYGFDISASEKIIIANSVELNQCEEREGENQIQEFFNENLIEDPSLVHDKKELLSSIGLLLNNLENMDSPKSSLQRNLKIFKDHFGLNGKELSISDLAKKYHITYGRVDQIIKKILRQCRHSSREIFLHAFCSDL